MTKERMMIFMIVVAVTVGAVFCWYYYGNKPLSRTKSDPVVTEEEKESSRVNKEDIIQFDSFEEASNVTVEKVIRSQTQLEDGSVNTSYDTYLLSDIDLKNDVDQTVDYSNASVGDGFEIDEAVSTDFISSFGFDYAQMDGAAIYKKILETEGINGDLQKVTFDQETYEMTGQEIYVLDEKCSVIDKMITDADEVISSKVSYQVKKDSTMPDYFSVVVEYKKGEQRIIKNLFLQVTINEGMEDVNELEK